MLVLLPNVLLSIDQTKQLFSNLQLLQLFLDMFLFQIQMEPVVCHSQCPISYSNGIHTQPLIFKLCYKPSGILQKVIKNKQVHISEMNLEQQEPKINKEEIKNSHKNINLPSDFPKSIGLTPPESQTLVYIRFIFSDRYDWQKCMPAIARLAIQQVIISYGLDLYYKV